MKCYLCNGNADLLTNDDRYICHSCAEKQGLVICTKIGKAINDSKFYCDHICSDCIFDEDEL